MHIRPKFESGWRKISVLVPPTFMDGYGITTVTVVAVKITRLIDFGAKKARLCEPYDGWTHTH